MPQLDLGIMTQKGNGQLPPVTPYSTLKEGIAGASRPSNFPGSKRVSSPEEGDQVPRPLVAETETSMVRCLGILGTGGSGAGLRERGQNLYFGMVRWDACQAWIGRKCYASLQETSDMQSGYRGPASRRTSQQRDYAHWQANAL